ncbi:MAG: DUF6265 family protein [Niabella sp.]
MKKILVLLTAVVVFSCNQQNKTNTDGTEKNIAINATTKVGENFDWLTGKWKRINEKKGKETFENWDKISSTEYMGIGFTMQNGDTISQEKMRITKQNEKWSLTVKVPHEAEAITFPMAELKDDEFTCTNDSLTFPKQIKYWKNGEKINALVAGDSLKIEFEFERIK